MSDFNIVAEKADAIGYARGLLETRAVLVAQLNELTKKIEAALLEAERL